MNVLFSGIGSTDPITNYRDGGLLHICRVYKPEKVYLYLTAEMCEYNDLDDRYCQALKLLGDKLNWKYELEIIRAEDMVDVQVFDSFIEPFEKILDYIMKKEKPEILYVNVSSGTPAMKSSLQTLSILWKNVVAVQVATPLKSSNRAQENKEIYELDIQWECDEDNKPDFENRCIESGAKRLLDRIRVESICKYIRAYDYEAARMLVEEMSVPPSDTFVKCLDVAVERQKLTIVMPTLLRYKKELPVKDWFAFSSNKDIKDFEYLLVMQTKLERKQYVDFVRDITPILFSLSERLLAKECNLTFDDIGMYNEKRNCYYISERKLKEKNLLLDARWDDSRFISSEIIIQILKKKSANKEATVLLEELREVEKNIRNKAAHEIVGLSYDDFGKKLNKKPNEIMNDIFKLAKYAGLNITKENRNIYNVMNEQLCDMLIIV